MRQVDISEKQRMTKTVVYGSENILFFLKVVLIQKRLKAVVFIKALECFIISSLTCAHMHATQKLHRVIAIAAVASHH